MDFGCNQRFGTTLGLSEVPNNAHVEVAVPLCALLRTSSSEDRLKVLLTKAHSLDREILQVMRQAIADALAREEISRPQAA
jgi:hypothetical protein